MSRRARPPLSLRFLAAVAAGLTISALAAAGAATPAGPVETRLQNGLRLLVQYNPASPVVAVCAFVHVSAAQETFNSAGARRLLLYMGERTRLRPGQEFWLAPPIELRSALSRDYVEMVVLCLPEDLHAALLQLRSALFDPYFEEGSLQFAQQRLYQEVLARQSLATTVAQDMLVGRLYPDWPGSWPLAGTGGATWVKLDFAQSFHSRHYVPNRTVLSVAGRVDQREVQRQVEDLFGNLVPGAPQRLLPPPLGATPRTGNTLVGMSSSSLSVVAVGGRAPALTDEGYPAASVLMALLGHGRGSRLYSRLREELKASYSIQAGITPSQVCPYAYLLAVCNREQIPSVTRAIQEELGSLAEQEPSAEELNRARRLLWGEFQVQQQDNQQLAHYLGLFALLGQQRGLSLRETFPQRLAAVRPEQVREQCRRIFAQPVSIIVQGAATEQSVLGGEAWGQ